MMESIDNLVFLQYRFDTIFIIVSYLGYDYGNLYRAGTDSPYKRAI